MICISLLFVILSALAPVPAFAEYKSSAGDVSLSDYFKEGSGCACALSSCTISSNRLLLRTAGAPDLFAIKNILRESDVIRNYMLLENWSRPHEKIQITQLMRGPRLDHSEIWGPSRKLNFVIESAGEVLGIGNLERFLAADEWEIGYAIAPHARERGIATETVDAMVQFIRATVPHGTITASPLVSNRQSHDILKKAGFRRNDAAVIFDPNQMGEAHAHFELVF